MKRKFLALALFAGSSMFAAPAVGIGIEIGAPPAPPRTHFVRPVAPGRDYVWINGYYEPSGWSIAGTRRLPGCAVHTHARGVVKLHRVIADIATIRATGSKG